MSSQEPLTDAQVMELRTDLLAQRERLARLAAQTTEGAAPVDLDEPIGRLSRMEALQQQAMSAANRRATEARLRLTDSALAKVASGDYGDCRSCDEPIGYARLKARPESPLCLGCQGSRER